MAVDSLQYKIEPLHAHGKSQLDALKSEVKDHAAQGWELVEACGDEIRMPALIFANVADAPSTEYLVEEVPHVKGKGEVDEIRETLLNRSEQGWLVLTVLDSPLSPPMAVYRKSAPASEPVIKVIVEPVDILGDKAETIKREITQQEIRNGCRLRTVMNSGLLPVLILITEKGRPEQEYIVEHARGGLFTGQIKKLTDLISNRSKEGWRVCGAFEDEVLLPCVVFCRDAQI